MVNPYHLLTFASSMAVNCTLWLFDGIQKCTARQSRGDCTIFEYGIKVIGNLTLNFSVRDCIES